MEKLNCKDLLKRNKIKISSSSINKARRINNDSACYQQMKFVFILWSVKIWLNRNHYKSRSCDAVRLFIDESGNALSPMFSLEFISQLAAAWSFNCWLKVDYKNLKIFRSLIKVRNFVKRRLSKHLANPNWHHNVLPIIVSRLTKIDFST